MDLTIMQITKKGIDLNINLKKEYRQHYDFWTLYYDKWEEATFNIFDRFLDENYNYLDIGSWIGPTVIVGAHKSNHVYAIEPNKLAFNELVGNISLNPLIKTKVTCINAALSPKSQSIKLYIRTDPSESMSSIVPNKQTGDYYDVKGITFDQLLIDNDIKNVNFIKMDIEAGEYQVLPTMRDYLEKNKPILYLSMHPPFILDSAELQFRRHNDKFKHLEYLTERLMSSLDFYKYIYDSNGNLIDANEVAKGKYFQSFVFSNEKW
ncbi:FkbM family methyltransferase [Paenibacillus solani]|uniref:FkbM family methyltransferase n=1 Tax=Paenibacillus solani TaxID=1705565 RepID=UPI003D2B8D8A